MLGSWFAPLLIHNHNQQTAMMRAAAAQAQGLDPQVYGVPLPGSNVTSTTTNNNASGFIKGAVLATAMLAAGGLGAAGLGKMLTQPAPPPQAPTVPQQSSKMPPPTPVAPTVPAGEDTYDIPWTVGPDGKIKWGEPKKVNKG
jgi:hypothetical protein